MKKIFFLALTALSLSSAASQLPFSETFDTLAIGPVDGTNGWVSLSGTAIIQSNVFENGSKAMEIQAGTVTHSLSNSNSSVWVNFQARIAAAPLSDPAVTNVNTSVAFFVNTNRNLVVYNGKTAVVLTNVLMQINQWTRFDIFCDYNSMKWLLSVDRATVAENLSLYSASSQIESLLIANDSASPVYFDELAVQDTEPTNVVASIDRDGDTIPDWWEQCYFGGVTNASPGQPGLNGLTPLQMYIAGLNPGETADLLKITKSDGRKLSWVRKPGRQYDIYWTADLTSSFTKIGTVAGNEFEDTETARTENRSGFYQFRVYK